MSTKVERISKEHDYFSFDSSISSGTNLSHELKGQSTPLNKSEEKAKLESKFEETKIKNINPSLNEIFEEKGKNSMIHKKSSKYLSAFKEADIYYSQPQKKNFKTKEITNGNLLMPTKFEKKIFCVRKYKCY